MKNKKNQIQEAIIRQLLGEADENPKSKQKEFSFDECDKIIGEVRKKLLDLSAKLKEGGIDTTCKPYTQLKQMNHILASFDPTEVNLKKYFTTKTNQAAASMFEEEEMGDIKITTTNTPQDKKKEQKAVEMSKKYDMDVELT